MNLAQHYSNLWVNSRAKFVQGTFEVDPFIDSPFDNRFGISLLARPCNGVIEKIQYFLSELKEIDPHQYYYPNSDIHITIMSIISCYPGFTLDRINVQEYADLVQEALNGISEFEIDFAGITASASCIMIQGFPTDNCLNEIRNQLRQKFRDSGLEQSIDLRYAIQTAHSTVVRFKKPVKHHKAFIQKLEEYKDHYFGTSYIDNVDLVYNDWYQKSELVKSLKVYSLRQEVPAALVPPILSAAG